MITFQEALAQISPADLVLIAQNARPGSEYLLTDFLPEMTKPTYDVGTGTITIRPTMAGLVGTDSPYPSGGAMEVSTFMQRTAKMAISIPMNEETIREIQEWQKSALAAGTAISARELVNQVLNFYRGVILQALWDRDEWLRGKALAYGRINWRFGDVTLLIDYGVPDKNRLTERTEGNGDAYHMPGSKFWDDVHQAQSLLAFAQSWVGVAHTDTIRSIIYNSANNILVQSDENGIFRLRRWTTVMGQPRLSDDARDTVTLIGYGQGGEIIDPTQGLDGNTTVAPFFDKGKLTWIGQGSERGYRFTTGARPDPASAFALGYVHLGPTVEANGQPGRWGRLRTPENAPWMLIGEAAENSLPVITNPKRMVIGTTDMPTL